MVNIHTGINSITGIVLGIGRDRYIEKRVTVITTIRILRNVG